MSSKHNRFKYFQRAYMVNYRDIIGCVIYEEQPSVVHYKVFFVLTLLIIWSVLSSDLNDLVAIIILLHTITWAYSFFLDKLLNVRDVIDL